MLRDAGSKFSMVLSPKGCQEVVDVDVPHAAYVLGIEDATLEAVLSAGQPAVAANTWVMAIASIEAPWKDRPRSVEEALEWAATTRGQERGWAIKFADGSTLGNTRRYDSTMRATYLSAEEAAGKEFGLKVQMGNTTGPGYVIVPA